MYHGLQKALKHVLLSCEAQFQLRQLSASLSTLPHSPISSSLLPRGRRRAAPSFFLPSFSSPPAETVEQFIQCHTFVAPIRTYPSGFRARARAHIWALFRCLLDDPFIQTESVCILTVPQAAIERMNVCGFLKHRPRHLIRDRLRPYLK